MAVLQRLLKGHQHRTSNPSHSHHRHFLNGGVIYSIKNDNIVNVLECKWLTQEKLKLGLIL